MGVGTIRRDGETPIYVAYCTDYCIIDEVCSPSMTRKDYPQALQDCALRAPGTLPGPQDIRIPSWQRKLVWNKDQIEKFLNSESSMFGTVIMAEANTGQEPWVLIDGLQRFSVGTALLNALYDEVLAPSPNRQTESKYFSVIKKLAQSVQPVFQWNHERLSNLGKRGVKNSYNELFRTIQQFVNEKLDEEPENFGKAIETTFMIRQVAVDPYKGFSNPSALIKTFLSINATGEPLTKLDLLRAKIIEHLESRKWPGNTLDEVENDYTDTFQNKRGKYFHDLGVNIYNTMFELPDLFITSGQKVDGHSPKYVFPNWDGLSKVELDDFFEYHSQIVSVATETTLTHKWKWPYLAEIFPFKLPYIMISMFYYKNHYQKFLAKRDSYVEKRKIEIHAIAEKISLHELQTRIASGAIIDFTSSLVEAQQEILEVKNTHFELKQLQEDLLDAVDAKKSTEEIEEIKDKITDIENNEVDYPDLFDDLPDFLGGDLDTNENIKKFYRATMRKVLDGNIGKTEKILHSVIRGSIQSVDELSEELNPDLAGQIDDPPNHNWLKGVILKSKKKSANPKIIFNACLLPDRNSRLGRSQFHPMIYKNGTNYYNVDHLIADSQKNTSARGLLELQNMVNLAPLEWTKNVLASSTECSLKLSTSAIYGTIKDKHPYCKWLVEVHYTNHENDDIVYPLTGETETQTQEDPATRIPPLDSQVNLLEGHQNSIANERVEKLIEILTPKL